jgi:hypothetical protein
LESLEAAQGDGPAVSKHDVDMDHGIDGKPI